MHAKAVNAFKSYKRELHRYLLRRLRQPQEVDDLAQDVYMRLLRIDDDKLVDKPLAFLYGVAKHVLADYRIDQEYEKEYRAHEDVDEAEMESAPHCVLPDQLADSLNLQQQIDHAFAQLPPTHAAVLLAHKRDGLSYDECAEKLGLSIHTVSKYVTQAKARVRTMTWER